MVKYNLYLNGELIEEDISKREFMDKYPEFSLREWENMRDSRSNVRGYQVMRLNNNESEADRVRKLAETLTWTPSKELWEEWDRVTNVLYPLVKGTNIKLVGDA